MDKITRREFIKISALSACVLMISTGLSGCNYSETNYPVDFKHGVASGDPLSDKVIIWTRVTTNAPEVKVNFEVAKDKEFNNIIHNGTYTTNADQDYTVKIDVQNLKQNSVYYYRFFVNDTYSDIGRTKTLPIGDIDKVKMVVFSCANYPNGYFNAYKEASKIEDLDVAIHLGDYIYEYGLYENDDFEAKIPAYGTSKAEKIGRLLPDNNNKECITLDDYRKRYALYHTDEGLQLLHKSVPMIAVWDDHEIANDAYKDGAENHQNNEGDYQKRVQAAIKAYFEWVPIRPVVGDNRAIYRSFTFGNLVSLNMLETRLLARDKQLFYTDYYDENGNFDEAKFTQDLTSEARKLMGEKQLKWLQNEFTTSSTTWEVIGQQVLIGRMWLPAEILSPIAKLDNPEAFGTTKEELVAEINKLLKDLVSIKIRILQGDSTVTDEEKARLKKTLPYNLDAWDGYFAERERLFALAKGYQKNLVVLSGDTHNSWANNLKDMYGEKIGVEFATTSVSSPGMEEYLGLNSIEDAKNLEAALEVLLDDLKYTNLNNRGFLEVIFTKDEAKANWHHINNVDSKEYEIIKSREKTLVCKVGKKELKDPA